MKVVYLLIENISHALKFWSYLQQYTKHMQAHTNYMFQL
jgi:hypothetical protein